MWTFNVYILQQMRKPEYSTDLVNNEFVYNNDLRRVMIGMAVFQIISAFTCYFVRFSYSLNHGNAFFPIFVDRGLSILLQSSLLYTLLQGRPKISIFRERSYFRAVDAHNIQRICMVKFLLLYGYFNVIF